MMLLLQNDANLSLQSTINLLLQNYVATPGSRPVPAGYPAVDIFTYSFCVGKGDS